MIGLEKTYETLLTSPVKVCIRIREIGSEENKKNKTISAAKLRNNTIVIFSLETGMVIHKLFGIDDKI